MTDHTHHRDRADGPTIHTIPPAETRLRRAVDRFFDGELGESERTRLIDELRRRPVVEQEARQTEEILHELRQPIPASDQPSPDHRGQDLADRVLNEVARRRGFLGRRHRRRVKLMRQGVGIALLLLLGGVALTHRLAPGLFRLTPADAPITALATNVEHESASAIADLVEHVQASTQQAQEQAQERGNSLLDPADRRMPRLDEVSGLRLAATSGPLAPASIFELDPGAQLGTPSPLLHVAAATPERQLQLPSDGSAHATLLEHTPAHHPAATVRRRSLGEILGPQWQAVLADRLAGTDVASIGQIPSIDLEAILSRP